MAIEIPNWLEPVLELYAIPWPDVDEDAFHDVKQPLRDFGQSLDAVGAAIEYALRALESGNASRTLQAILVYVEAIRQDYLRPINQVCDDLAGTPCDLAFDMIVGTKYTLIGMLAGEIANDVADIAATVVTFGADAALTAAEALGVREAISRSLTIAENDIASAVLAAANVRLDNFVSSLVNPFISREVHGIEAMVDSYTPRFLLQQALNAERTASAVEGQAAGILQLSPSELEACIERIRQSSQQLDSAEQRLAAAIDELFSHPAPNAPNVPGLSAELRIALKGVVHTMKSDLLDALRTLIQQVVQHFIALLDDYKRALDDLNEQAAAIASSRHASAGAPVVVLSAAGVGAAAAAGASAVSGLINAQEAEGVQVEVVVSEDTAEFITVRSDSTVVQTEVVTTTVEVTELAPAAAAPTVTAATVTSSAAVVESFTAKTTAETPRVSPVDGAPAPAASVSAHHDGGHEVRVTDAAASQAGANAPQLRVKRPVGKRPRLANAEQTAGSVAEVRNAAKAARKPTVDTSPADEQTHE